MRGGCRSCGFLSIFLVSVLLACGDDRGAGAAPGDQTRGGTVSMLPDTTSRAADTAASRMLTSDSTPATKPAADSVAASSRKTPPPSQPAPRASKPAAPAPKPAAPAAQPPAAVPADTPAPTATTDTAPQQTQANAPLRDEYHRAPLDTVSQEVYDGWKQYNLNCARCHGEDVLGTTIAPHLVVSVKPDGPINTKELFVQTVCAGRPEKGMPAWCPLGLEMDKIEAIYSYVKGRSEGKIRPGRPALKAG